MTNVHNNILNEYFNYFILINPTQWNGVDYQKLFFYNPNQLNAISYTNASQVYP